MKRNFLIGIFYMNLCLSILRGEDVRVEPPFWWSGMVHSELQILLYGPGFSQYEVGIDSKDVKVVQTTPGDSPNYLFVYLDIKNAKPGTLDLQLKKDGETQITLDYELKKRVKSKTAYKGFNPSDAIYLINPDRFANGDPSNDTVEGMEEPVRREKSWGRHGGDIEGMIQHLDYIKDMGFTQIWSTPLTEMNMGGSYHGYATTDYYKIDPRYGTNELYQKLSAEAKMKGIGIIMDMVPNHIGWKHWWIKDEPFKDWFNNRPENYHQTNHNRVSILDPHGAEVDRRDFEESSFVKSMPDLNQRNPHLAQYLKQNSVWWVESSQLSGIRVDTFSYSNKHFLSSWTKYIMDEYPNFNMVGEEWINDPEVISYWLDGKVNLDGFECHLPTAMDFPLGNSIKNSLRPNSGFHEVYECLSRDFLYPNPENLVIFADNHDMDRIYTRLKEDYNAFQTAMAIVMTTRGIPQIFYGTEILKTHEKLHDHPTIRSDFPGGWQGDEKNAFTKVGLSEEEGKAQDFIKTVLNWRKTSEAIHKGKLIHFKAENGVYVYFRYIEGIRKKVMVIVNKFDNQQSIILERYKEVLSNNTRAKNIVTGQEFTLGKGLVVQPKIPMILELD